MEGPEGSGKSTQTKELASYLKGKGLDVITTQEPGGTKIGRQIRNILLSPYNEKMNPKTELLLFLASRADHLERVVKPALQKGKVVISDRYLDSSLAYQSFGRGLDERMVRQLNDQVTGGLKPDLTILLDIEVPLGIKRALSLAKEFSPSGEGDRMEKEEIGFHQRVRQGYLTLSKKEPERIKVIEVGDTVKKTQRQIRKFVDELLERRKKVAL